jgi:Tol biopolymer transport system component
LDRLSPGTRLGPYEIVAPAGAGGMGEVWRARDTRLERSVAIKVLPQEFAENAQLKLRFEREAKTISQLNHPHICTLFDVGHENGLHYLVMEYIEGETLAERLAKGPLPVEQVIRYGVEIAAALERAHRAGVIHRDLKPGNIMLTKDGAKLLDFGLAKESEQGAIRELTSLHTERRALTEEGTIVGTFQYMAPEQLEGQPVDHRADIFALGAVLYEMATGRRAFQGKSKASLIASILATDPPPISSVQPLTPAALDRVIVTCLDKDPDERFQSAHDVRLELQWAGQQGAAVAAAPAHKPGRAVVPWTLATLLAIALAAAGVRLVQLGAAARKVRPVRTSIVPPEGTAFAFDAAAAPPEISPDGTRIVFGAAKGALRSLWLRSLESPVPRELGGTEGASFPFWSPDGRFIAFCAENRLKKLEVASGSIVTICEANDARGGSWSRGGTIIFGLRYSPIWRVNASGGTPVEVTAFDAGQRDSSHRWPRFLPDGRHFLFLATPTGGEDPSNTICVGSLDTKMRKAVLQASSQPLYFDRHLLYVRDGILIAQPFDEKGFVVTGEPVALSAQQIAGNVNFSRRVVSISTNGTLIYQNGESIRNSQLAWVARDGKVLATLGEPEPYGGVRISPDGQSVVTVIRSGTAQNLWLFDARGVKSRLTFGREAAPIWSPDGTRIAYVSRPKNFGELYVHDLRSGSDEELLVTGADKTATSWSADGQILFYTEVNRAGSGGDIWYLTLADRKPHLYLRTPYPETSAQISADGKWVAYQGNETGRAEIYIAPFPPTGAKWQVSNGGAAQPRWSRDGKELFFITLDDPTLISVPVRLGVTPQIGPQSKLFEFKSGTVGFPYDAAPDGRFLVNARLGEAPPPEPITLVQNFATELREQEAKQD